MRAYIGDLVSVVVGDNDLEVRLWRELRRLADELNSGLEEYQVSLEHLDTEEYLTFQRVAKEAQQEEAE